MLPPSVSARLDDTLLEYWRHRVEQHLQDSWSTTRSTRTAIEAWLQTDEGSRFTVRRDLELYGLSCHPGGFLQRRA